ncbi:hypothetical protein ABK040_003347 [Willaertia magna]
MKSITKLNGFKLHNSLKVYKINNYFQQQQTISTTTHRNFIFNPFGNSDTNQHNSKGGNGIKYVEQRIIGYSQKQVFDVVSNVNNYKNFLPHVNDSKTSSMKPISDKPDKDGLIEYKTEGSLTVGFSPFTETYVSNVFLKSPVSVKAISENTKLFNRLVNHWTMAEGPSDNTCRLTFQVDFEFASKWYQTVANMFFNFLVKDMTDAFEKEMLKQYGPPSQITKKVYSTQKQC